MSIEYLGDFLNLDSRHGNGINIENVSRDFREIEIDSQFSSVDINLERGSAATLNFDLQFGNLRAYGDGINFNKVIKEHTSSYYEGYLKSQNASSSIKVNSRHGNIRLDVR